MPRPGVRRQGSGERRRDEEYAQEYGGKQDNDGKSDREPELGQISDSSGGQAAKQQSKPGQGEPASALIADMAKGFMEAQAKIATAGNSSDSEMVKLLQKISQQLEGLQPPQTSGGSQKSRTAKQNEQPVSAQNSSGPQSSGNGQDLQALFSRLLKDDGQQSGSQNANTAQSSDNQSSNDQSSNDQSSKEQNANQGKQRGSGGPQTVTAQTAAQVLAQAQYELANELEASLKKLRKVIDESEQLANRISDLIGEDKKQNS